MPVGDPAGALQIGAATRADVADLLAMIRALARYERLEHLCVATEADLAAALFADPVSAEVRIARLSGQPAGFALFFHTFSTFRGRRGLWLEDLFVEPQFRSRGVGKALLRAVAALAHERGCARFEWAVLDWNAPAIRFYESVGATVMPDWRIARVVSPALERVAALPAAPPGPCPPVSTMDHTP